MSPAGITTVDRADLTPRTPALVEQRHLAIDPRIRAKLTGLQAAADMAGAARSALHGRLDDLRVELGRKKRLLDHDVAAASPAHTFGVPGHGPDGAGLVAPVTFGGGPGPERAQELDRLAAALDQISRLYQDAEGKWRVLIRLAQNCATFFEQADLAALMPVVVTYERILDPRTELAAIREQLDALAKGAQAIEVAPVPAAEALARLDEQRRKVAARVAARRTERARAFFSPRGVTDITTLGVAYDFGRHGREIEDAIREAADERFLADVGEWQKAIKAHVITGKPVPLADRAPRLAQLARDRAELERQEERVVLCAERDGLQLDRRDTAEPNVVLCTVFASDAA